MIVFGFEVYGQRWPWQTVEISFSPDRGKKYGWRSKALSMGRFGGGWHYSLGIEIGGSSAVLNLLFGMVRITKLKRCKDCGRYIKRGQKRGNWRHDESGSHLECVEARHRAEEALR